jgi:hypothetical protein
VGLGSHLQKEIQDTVGVSVKLLHIYIYIYIYVRGMVEFCKFSYNVYGLFYIDCVVRLHNLHVIYVLNYTRKFIDFFKVLTITRK